MRALTWILTGPNSWTDITGRVKRRRVQGWAGGNNEYRILATGEIFYNLREVARALRAIEHQPIAPEPGRE